MGEYPVPRIERIKMRIKTTNPRLKKTIQELEKEKGLWRKVGKELDRPNRIRAEVNLFKLNKETEEGDVVIVPGKVLGYGELNHSIKIGALSYSGKAREKIEESGSKALKIEEIKEEDPAKEKIKVIK